jgi:hypothetical protein
VIKRPHASRQRQRFAPDAGREQFQFTPEIRIGFDADGASAQATERDIGIGEHLHRMKSAGQGACGFRVIQRRQFGRSAAMDDAVTRLPAQIATDRQDRVVAYRQEDQIADVHDLLRLRHRPGRRHPRSQQPRRIGAAVVEGRDIQARAVKRRRQRLRHTTGADEADFQRRERCAHCA